MTRSDDSDTERSQTNTTRRSVLKAVGAGATIGSGALVSSSKASAASQSEPAAGYDAETARTALSEQTGDLLAELERRGVLREASISAFGSEELQAPRQYRRSVEGVTAIQDGDGARVMASTETETHEIEIAVPSDRDVSLAFVKSKQDGEVFGLRSQGGEVEPASCSDGVDCSCGDPCMDDSSKSQEFTQHCCLYPDGSYECGKWEPSGCCTC